MIYRLAFLALILSTAPVTSHSIYDDWHQPGSEASCCSDHDCEPTRAWVDDSGRWVARHQGRDVVIPMTRVLKGPSPDGRSHLCVGPNDIVYCFMPGEIRS